MQLQMVCKAVNKTFNKVWYNYSYDRLAWQLYRPDANDMQHFPDLRITGGRNTRMRTMMKNHRSLCKTVNAGDNHSIVAAQHSLQALMCVCIVMLKLFANIVHYQDWLTIYVRLHCFEPNPALDSIYNHLTAHTKAASEAHLLIFPGTSHAHTPRCLCAWHSIPASMLRTKTHTSQSSVTWCCLPPGLSA